MSTDPPDPTSEPPEDPGLLDETLSRLERRLDRASEAAERLIVEAAARAAGSPATGPTGSETGDPPPGEDPKPPPAGWQRPQPGSSARAEARARGEFDLLLEVLAGLRDRIPPELQRRLGEALREVLLALRALIDWYLERTDRRRAEPAEVQDIPIV
ncbi:MAG TPA: hypothetical protein VGL51_16965 [Solirubrobacteraceae bacterium]